MNALIVEPIKRVERIMRFLAAITFGLKLYPTLIVIDGLDEVEGKDIQADLIKIIGNAMKDVRLPLRFLIASRPEPHIVDAINKLRSQFPEDRVSIMDLREDTLVHRDIRRYFTVKFEEIQANDTYLPQDWPGEDVVDQLVDKASGQFIYACHTSCLHTIHRRRDLQLYEVCWRNHLATNPTRISTNCELYSHIVRNANRRADMLRIMGLLIVINQLIATVKAPSGVFARRLYSPRTLGDILGLGRGSDVRRCLMDMHSVVSVADEDPYLQIYHKSFPDFLLDPSRSNEFAINVEDLRDTLFSYLVTSSFEHRDTTLRILGQVIVAGLPPDLNTSSSPPNSSSPQWIAGILCLDSRVVMKIVTELHLLLEVGKADEDIRIRHESFVEFLLDRTRSQDLFLDLDGARIVLRDVAAIVRWIYK